MGIAAGIFALVVIVILLVGLVLNHRRLVELRGRRDELDDRVVALEARLAQLAEMERRLNLANRRPPQAPPVTIAAPGLVRRVPPPPIPIRPGSED